MTEKKTKKPSPKPGQPYGAKAKFVLSQPREMPALDVVQKAKAAGLDISIAYVHTTRSNSRRGYKRATKPGVKVGRPHLPPKPAGFTSLSDYVLRKEHRRGSCRARSDRAAAGRAHAQPVSATYNIAGAGLFARPFVFRQHRR